MGRTGEPSQGIPGPNPTNAELDLPEGVRLMAHRTHTLDHPTSADRPTPEDPGVEWVWRPGFGWVSRLVTADLGDDS